MKPSFSRIVFQAANVLFLMASAVLCLLPIVNMVAVSFSSGVAASAGYVKFWPVRFTLDAYRFIISNDAFWRSFAVSLERIALALPLSLLATLIAAFPMSKNSKEFPGRQFYTFFFVIPMLFSGGLIPWYLTMRALKLTNSIWGLVVPNIVSIFNVILLMNFFKNMPRELEDAALVDGAGPIAALFWIYAPLSKPCMATISLFIIVGNWNAWFDGIILMDLTRNYPLQSYLQSLLVQIDPRKVTSSDIEALKVVSNRTFRAAQIFVAMVPMLVVYPFLQKYFAKGIMLGSVKG